MIEEIINSLSKPSSERQNFTKKIIKNINDLYEFSGFDIEKYHKLETMSDVGLIFQVTERLMIQDYLSIVTHREEFLSFTSELARSEKGNETAEDISSKEIERIAYKLTDCFSNPILKNIKGDFIREHEFDLSNVMSFEGGITPLNRFDLERIVYKGKVISGLGKGEDILPPVESIESMKQGGLDDFYFFMWESLNKIMELKRSELYVSINLNHDDSELIENFKSLLKKWRQELNINEPEKDKSWWYVKNRILEYKIIPILDILNLASACGLQISNRLIAIAVYPHGERDGFGISQTVMPFIDKSITLVSMHKYKEEVNRWK